MLEDSPYLMHGSHVHPRGRWSQDGAGRVKKTPVLEDRMWDKLIVERGQ